MKTMYKYRKEYNSELRCSPTLLDAARTGMITVGHGCRRRASDREMARAQLKIREMLKELENGTELPSNLDRRYIPIIDQKITKREYLVPKLKSNRYC